MCEHHCRVKMIFFDCVRHFDLIQTGQKLLKARCSEPIRLLEIIC